MSIRSRTSLATLLAMIATLLAPRAAEAGNAVAVQRSSPRAAVRADSTALRQLQLRFEATSDSARVHHVAHQRVTQPVMAQRFRIELAGSQPDSGMWHAVLRVHGRDVGVQLRFTPDEQDVVLPRPLGVALRAGDSITLSVHAPHRTSSGLVLLLSIDYEPLEVRGSRLSVDPLSADLTTGDNARSVSWEFSPESGGRVLAVCGALLAHASSVQLVSVTSGEVLWSLNVPVRTGHGSAELSDVVRLGVPVRAGETYRLTVVLADSADAAPTLPSATAMVLPQRRVQ